MEEFNTPERSKLRHQGELYSKIILDVNPRWELDATATFSAGKLGENSMYLYNGVGTETITCLQVKTELMAVEITVHTPDFDCVIEDTGVFRNTDLSASAAANFLEIVCHPIIVSKSIIIDQKSGLKPCLALKYCAPPFRSDVRESNRQPLRT